VWYERGVRRVFATTLRAAGILVAVWAILGLVGWAGGAIPPGQQKPDEQADPAAEETRDAGTAKLAGPLDAGADPDTGAPDTTAPTKRVRAEADAAVDDAGGDTATASAGDEPATTARHTRYVACDPTTESPSVSALHVVGDPRPELAVGCGDAVHVLAVRRTGKGPDSLVPERILTFELQTEVENATRHAAAPAAGDVDGDSAPDLVMGFWRTRKGAPRGGSLYVARRNATGAFESPRRLAPVAAVDLTLAQLDSEPGLDLVVLNRANPLARRPSQVWVFSGGASPTRTAVVETGIDAEAVAVTDLDQDGHADVIAASTGEPRVDAFFGDGTGRFPRSATLSLPEAKEVLATDLQNDGRGEVLVRARGLHLVEASGSESLRATPIDAPDGIHGVRVTPFDDDDRPDVLGIADDQLVWLRQGQALAFEQRTLWDLPSGAPKPAQLELADLDADGTRDLVVAAQSHGGPSELWLVPGSRPEAGAKLSEEVQTIPDAPLRLQIPLR
jgi:hypothetical protein